MASETSDLRSGSKEHRRDKERKVKWAYGTSFGPGRRAEDNRPRPARIDPVWRKHNGLPKGEQKVRAVLNNDIHTASGESSADEDIEEPSAAPAPDAEITYSYDAERGPSHGSQVLGLALAKAIERYEVRQTDKLIKEEYEVLDATSEALAGPRTVKRPEDEDYEFVEA
ncbi:uncharacterized protein EI97DRAFT_447497 [Westerdykella ornata]|uniref:Uncharacterized protein n=1 Tax=Westerdykella ornata TaxID=318751 RepID=A0A6A6JY57_WESOR|nr:uncharacterized protein EI97DRAFT_447497 [Westerdykella ornata]KAF2281561.1 hypothetical protein EI97DRAFT_447497 [Westerdykella ornata]